MLQHAEALEKGRTAMADAIMAQVDEIDEDIDTTKNEIEEIEETPKKRNRNTPPDAPDD